MGPQQYSLVFGINAIGIVSLGQLSARLVGRFGPTRLLVAGLTVGFVGGLGLVAAVGANAPLWLVLSALFVIVASMGLVMPNATALALADYGRAAGSASAMLGLGQFVVGGIAAPLSGALPLSPPIAMAAMMATFSGLAGLSFVLGGRLRRSAVNTARDERLVGAGGVGEPGRPA